MLNSSEKAGFETKKSFEISLSSAKWLREWIFTDYAPRVQTEKHFHDLPLVCQFLQQKQSWLLLHTRLASIYVHSLINELHIIETIATFENIKYETACLEETLYNGTTTLTETYFPSKFTRSLSFQKLNSASVKNVYAAILNKGAGR